MSLDNALPTGADSAAAGEPATPAAAAETSQHQSAEQGAQDTSAEGSGEGQDEQDGEGGDKPAKKEKTPEQREIERLRRRVDNTTKHKHMLEAELQNLRSGRAPAQQQETQGGDGDSVTLSRAELDRMIAERAEKLAPAVKEQQVEIERRQGVIDTLTKAWGKDEFNAKAEDLDAAFGGLSDRSGRPKPATEAIFEADDPKGVIEYLTDPDNAAEAERISRLPAVRVGREVARIEEKLKAEKAKAKPQASDAPKPIEAVRGGGTPKGMPDPANTKAYIKWANEQERAGR